MCKAKKRAYFKDIHILVPESWRESSDYSSAEWQRYDQSDVMIDFSKDGSTNNNRPYVYKPTPCGEQGEFIHLTPDYLLSENTARAFGPYTKTLTHEWAHYRWGVFDEYPLQNGQHFYADAEGNIEAVRCVSKIQGERVNPKRNFGPCQEDENGLPERDCRFQDDYRATDYTGSLMYKQFLPAISTFCEKAANGVPEGNAHNREAPNVHNIMCKGKSVWEVMLEHSDFAPGKGIANNANDRGEEDFEPNPVPEFTVVKKTSSRFVLVVDTSGSMKGQRLRQLKQAADLLISEILNDGEKLGIVEFAETSRLISGLQSINAMSRQMLLNKITSLDANGWTSIGAGVVGGLEVLQDGSMNAEAAAGGKMIIITDGEENEEPYIRDVLHLVNGSSVTICTIAIGPDASSDLELLPALTGGTAYSLKEESNSLSDAFSTIPNTEKDITSTPTTVYSEFIQIPVVQLFTDAVYIDATIGSDTLFVFGHTTANSISVRVTDPTGRRISEGSPEYDANPTIPRVRVAITGDAQVGQWTFEIENNQQELENVTVLVQSQARENQEPIMIRSQWRLASVVPPQTQSLYVSVGQGYTPVVEADVKAVVDLPCGNGNESVTLRPKDNGIGADIHKNDGVYSSYFTEFCGAGRYGVNIEVINNGEVTSVASGGIIGVGAAIDPELARDGYERESELRSTGDFRRVTLGGSFKCEGAHICNASTDVYPPARITDLMATNVDPHSKQIKLTFTAPGDDLSTGKASHYIIVMSRSVSDILDNFDSVSEVPLESYAQGNVMTTKDAGETEVFVIQVTDVGKFSYSFAVVTVDDVGNRGEPSNVATSSARERRPVPGVSLPLGLVVGCVVGGAVLMLLMVMLAVCAHRKRRQRGGKGTPETPWIDQESSRQRLEGGRQATPRENQYVGSSVATVPVSPSSGPMKPHTVPLKPPTVPLKLHTKPVKPPIATDQSKQPTGPPRPPSVTVPVFPPSDLHDDVTGRQHDLNSHLYDHVISRRERDPNWDPTLPNNSEGGGANIKAGHVANTRAAFDNLGFMK
ncbi:epithelial chloride channel protein-like isoform X2 [Acanthaster planci]|uniref:Epithelial chloride channel protein-like isoform X2 n=1 Tax=Acanthaster planci TaxID=133434 RepID=A0A8B7Z0S9_ACAPL|nr:epithelial chloride channel protein-like isoform X2 [Acanthaster planci]